MEVMDVKDLPERGELMVMMITESFRSLQAQHTDVTTLIIPCESRVRDKISVAGEIHNCFIARRPGRWLGKGWDK
jgi:hypothetical protein